MDARVRKLAELAPSPRSGPAFGLEALSGRFVELSGAQATGVLTAAFGLVLEAQFRGEIVAWVAPASGTFFAPDAHDGGIDLDALVVVRVPDATAAGRAADQLLRSGGFGLVILDLHAAPGVNPGAALERGAPAPRTPGPGVSALPRRRPGDASLPPALQSRLAGLAQKHDATIVALTEKRPDQASLGAMVSLRAEARRGAGFTCVVRALKDRRRGPGGADRVEPCRPPDGAAPGANVA